MAFERDGRPVRYQQWTRLHPGYLHIRGMVAASARDRLATFLDSLTAHLSRVIATMEVVVPRVARVVEAAIVTKDLPTWERRLNAAIAVASALLVWVFLWSLQVVSRELIEFITEAINTALTKLDFPAS